MIVTGIYRYILPYKNKHSARSECSECSECSERSECSEFSESSECSKRSTSSEHSEPYVELLILENSEEHMVTVKYDSTGSYFIFNNKRYNVKNIGAYFNPVFIIEDD